MEASEEWFRVPPGLSIPREIRWEFDPLLAMTHPGEELVSAPLGEDLYGWLIAEYDEGRGRYVVRELAIRAREGAEVSGAGLRTVRVATLLRTAVYGTFKYTNVRDGLVALDQDWGKLRPRQGRPTPPETLRAVAFIYRIEEIAAGDPVRAVAARMQVAPASATKLVRRAREQGYFDA